MKNKLKEMLLQHKPITEETFDIEAMDGESFEKERESDGHTPESIASLHNVSVQDILDQIEEGIKVEREHTSDEAEARLVAMDHLVELPDYYTRLDKMEEEGEKDLEDAEVEEDVEVVPAEEDNHTIADAIEESFLIPKSLKMKYHNSRINANAKKVNKNLDKLEKAKKEWGNNPVGADTIDKLKAKVDNKATKLDAHTDKYKEVHDKKHEGLAKKTLYKPGKLEKMIKDPRKLNKIANPSMFVAQAENRAKSDNEILDRLVKTTSKHRDDQAKHTKELKQAGQPGKAPERKEEPRAVPHNPTTRVAPTVKTAVQPTVQTPHQKVANNAASVKERLSKVRASM